MTSDYTVAILRLNISWRYWIFKLTKLSEFYFENGVLEQNGMTKEENNKLKTRMLISIDGLEVFMYNRTPAYNNMMEILKKTQTNKEDSTLRFRQSLSSSSLKHSDLLTIDSGAAPNNTLLTLLKFLPVALRIRKGAIVLGNATTPSIVVASFKSSNAIIDVTRSPCPLDYYRFFHDYNLEKFQISMKVNISYDKQRDSRNKNEENITHKNYKHFYRFHRATTYISKAINKLRKRQPHPKSYDEWRGLRRYIGDVEDEKVNLNYLNSVQEYAKYSLILDTVTTRLVYYYDAPGLSDTTTRSLPEFGVDLELSMATIHYGPWADKQRIPIQNMFFPATARDSEPTQMPAAGSPRIYSGFKFNISVKDEVVFRVPTREPSKDNEILRSQNLNLNATKLSRPFGWIELKIDSGSTITSFNSFIATKKGGWDNRLTCKFNGPELRSSVNHDVLFTADRHIINCDIGFPLKWNGKCNWKFNNTSFGAKLFFLREHTMLFSDIFSDFGSGAPTPYENFRPFVYTIDWKMNGYKIYLNVNDSNIINNPLDFNSNKYISFQGDDLNIEIIVPLNGYFTKSTTIDYRIFANHFSLILDTPPWHTVNTFVKSKLMGQGTNFLIDGSYTYFSSVEVNTSNHIVIRSIGDNITLKFHGFLIKYLFLIRENYMGDHKHFQTFEEYNNSLDSASELSSTLNEEVDYWNMTKTENDVDILFTFQARHGLIVLPYHQYDCNSHIGLQFDSLDVDVRFTNYYLDLQADFSTITGVFVENERDEMNSIFNIPQYKEKYLRSRQDLKIDDFTVHAHRMFGLPPHETTYYCKWDFACGPIDIDSNAPFFKALFSGVRNFTLGFKDLENSLSYQIPIVYDAANFSFRCPHIKVKLSDNMNDSTLVIDLDSVLVNFNDVANTRYSIKIDVSIPEVKLEMLDASGTHIGRIETAVVFNNIVQKQNYLEHRRLQQAHVREGDAPHHRCPFILFPENRDETYYDAYGSMVTSLSLPDASYPLTEETNRIYDTTKNYSFVSLDFRSTINDDNFPKFVPTSDYSEEDFCPQYEVDPNYKYNNFICDLGELNGNLTPAALLCLAGVFGSCTDYSPEALLDLLQNEIINYIKFLITPICLVDNVRFVCPAINFKFCESVSTLQKLLFIQLLVHEPSLVLSTKITRTNDHSTLVVTKELQAAFHVRECLVSISNPKEFSSPAIVTIKDLEGWYTKSDCDVVSNLNFECISIDVRNYQLPWLIDYGSRLKKMWTPVLEAFEKIGKNKRDWKPELVYKLTEAYKKYLVDHDPGVLTKPSYILRACQHHVRFHDRWKLVTRLRYTLDSLPSSWATQEFENTSHEIPDSAYDEVCAAFSIWRNWEANLDQRRSFFDEVFHKEPLSSPDFEACVHANSISFRLLGNDKNIDYVYLDDVAVTFDSAKEKFRDLINLNLGFIDTMKNVNLVVNVQGYNSTISPLLFDLVAELQHSIPTTKKPIKEPVTMKLDLTESDPENQDISITVKFGSIKQQMVLPFSKIEFEANSLIVAGQAYIVPELKKEMTVTFSTSVESCELNLWEPKDRFFAAEVQHFNLVFANIGDLIVGSKTVDLFIDKARVKILDPKGKFPDIVSSIIKVDGEYLRSLMPKALKEPAPQPEPASQPEPELSLLKRLGIVNFNLQLGYFQWYLEFLAPLKVNCGSYNNKLSVSYSQKMASVETFIDNVSLDLILHKVTILNLENSRVLSRVKVAMEEDLLFFNVIAGLGYTKLSIPQIVKTLDVVLSSRQHLFDKIDRLKKLLKLDLRLTKNVQPRKPAPKLPQVAFKVAFTNDYIGVSTLLNSRKFAFETDELSLFFSNLEKNSSGYLGDYDIVGIHGELIVPTTRISVVDRSIPVGLSNLLDLNISIKISNENESEDCDKGKGLQIESQYCRICFSPQMLLVLINLVDNINSTRNKYPGSKKLVRVPQEKQSPALVVEPFLKFVSFHILCYNFCVGWIFGEQRKDYPGIILGAERFFGVTKRDMGKLSLMEGYLSVANGSTSSNFYSASSEKSNLNRAYLPTMQIIYITEEKDEGKHRQITILGDELDVKFLSNSIVIVEHAVNSVTKVQKQLEQRSAMKSAKAAQLQQLQRHRSFDGNSEQIPPAKESEDYMSSFGTQFNSLECLATFAGSNVLFYRLNDDESTPSLFLHSPAVKIATKYRHQKHAKKKHLFKSEVLTSSSDNTLYSSCVPVIMDIVEGVTKMMRKTNTDRNEVQKDPSEPTSKDFSIGKLLDDIDLHFGLKIESQKLSLSCVPTAKVAAIVGLEGIYLQFNSGDSEVPSIVGAMQFDALSASLQHIYSREVSGSIGIDSIVLTSFVSFDKVTNVLSSGSLSKVKGYINVKQYQDLELFKDIWFPKKQSAHDVNPHTRSIEPAPQLSSALATNKNISSRFKEVSTTYAIPWVLTLMILDISLQVDFGQSLGNFALKMEKFWVVSKKSTDWAQDLKVGINSVSLVSEGRLGGYISLNSAFLHTAISWKLDDKTTLDVPLILVSGGVDKLHMKISFDYHVFAIANVVGLSIDIFNQKNEMSISKDHLFVTNKFKSSEVYITSLAASNFFDIYNTISRMVQENRNSYRETLRESNKGKDKEVDTNTKASHNILEAVRKLETKIEVVSERLLIHVYPSSFDDSKVLVVRLDESRANFQQSEYVSGVSNELEIQFNDLTVSLSMTSTALEDFIQQCEVEEFVDYASKASGGTIFVFPRFMISMRTFQKYKTNTIEYLYQSSFGGTVDIKWNLGSVNFIREMYSVHKNALASRTNYRRQLVTDEDINEHIIKEKAMTHEKSGPSPIMKKQLSQEDTTNDIDQAISDTITKVATDSKYTYIPLAPPIIEAPRLKELGNATPPLEWFGLHRNKLPNATHQMGIVSLQKLIHEVELQYSKILGKA